MKHARTRAASAVGGAPDSSNGADELDRLVLAEIDLLTRVAPAARAVRPRRGSPAPAERPADPPPNDDLDAGAEAFLESAVEWLRGRRDRDAVLAELWVRLFTEPAAPRGGPDAAPAPAEEPRTDDPPPVGTPGDDRDRR